MGKRDEPVSQAQFIASEGVKEKDLHLCYFIGKKKGLKSSIFCYMKDYNFKLGRQIRKIMILTMDDYLLLGWVIQSWVKKPKVCVKSGFRSESYQRKFRILSLQCDDWIL